MKITREIEIDEENYLEVEFEGYSTPQDDSYSDEYGLVKFKPYPIVENITWPTESFSKEENKIIDKYLTDNFASIESEIIKEEENYYGY